MTTKHVCFPDEIPEELNAQLQQLHCHSCGRFLCYHAIIEGAIAVKCRTCKIWNVLDIRSIDTEDMEVVESPLKAQEGR